MSRKIALAGLATGIVLSAAEFELGTFYSGLHGFIYGAAALGECF